MTRLFLGQLKAYLPPFNDARRALGLAPLGTARELVDQYHAADLRLIQTSEAFDFPITPTPPNVRYVGPVLDDPDWTGEWRSPWPEADPRPLVVASLSSTFQDQRGLLQRIIAALGTLEVRGLVTLGPAMAGERFDVPGERGRGRLGAARAGVPARRRHGDARGARHGDARAGARRPAPLPPHGPRPGRQRRPRGRAGAGCGCAPPRGRRASPPRFGACWTSPASGRGLSAWAGSSATTRPRTAP